MATFTIFRKIDARAKRLVTVMIMFFMLIMTAGCDDEQLCQKDLLKVCAGCNPYVERLAVAAKKLDKTLRTEVKKCADATLNASVKDVKYAEAAFKGCISSNTTLDDKSRDALLKLIDEAKVSDKQYDIWLACYENYLVSLQANRPRSKPVVVLMDSHIKGVVYCKHTQDIGGSNADDITNLIKDLSISIHTASTNLEWQDDQRVINLQPALIVLHASAFYKETKEMEGNKKLIDFLDGLKKTGIKVLVYTRGLEKNPSEGLQIRWGNILKALDDPDLKKNAMLFEMPKGHEACFTDPEVGRPFKKKIMDMLALK